MKKIIFGVTGEMASGKGVIAKYLNEKYNAQSFKYSSILRELLDAFGIDKSRKNLSIAGTNVREIFGDNAITGALMKKVENSENKIIVVEGIRHKDEVKTWKKLENFILVAVDADPQIRYERLVARNENAGDAEKTFADFMHDSRDGMEKNIVEIIGLADEKINNNGTLEELLAQIEVLIAKYAK